MEFLDKAFEKKSRRFELLLKTSFCLQALGHVLRHSCCKQKLFYQDFRSLTTKPTLLHRFQKKTSQFSSKLRILRTLFRMKVYVLVLSIWLLAAAIADDATDGIVKVDSNSGDGKIKICLLLNF